VYTDRSFSFVLKTPPAAVLLKRAAGIVKGVSLHLEEGIVGSVTGDQVREIVATKMPDLNARTEAAAFNIIAGTARSMGIEIKD
jgi:large subunit ribosomal protein L11